MVPAKRHPQREVHKYPAGAAAGPELPPEGGDCGYGLVMAGLADGFDQRVRTGPRDHGPTVPEVSEPPSP
ncbi:hypothetical protein GCM10017744_004940 [Streptomyces antimycoticus]|uniref:Uncharacterized protein n=1 Tax=Streptomyces antimycoticus TaxID=68175 RepID=A0A4D4KQA7_9ACTN|nr:hypothetical protein SANT12839_094890 [Streptomyces antimycoticus]